MAPVTEQFTKRRKARNLALAGVLVAFVVLVYIISIVRLGLLK
ncbi:MAG TPA: hypothetical protein VM689_15220 [Aliidongia sp.]|nr:hypothetical protein [Aliidongia sp.]